MEGFATVEEALEELRNGKLILVTDDEDRENEGDFICAAELPQQKISILWQCMPKGLFVCRCLQNM